jgi:hypothetical protein
LLRENFCPCAIAYGIVRGFMISTTLMRVTTKQRELGISSATVSRLAGLRSAALSDALREVSRLSSEQEAHIEQVLNHLVLLDSACRPFRLPLDAMGVADLRQILESRVPGERVRAAIQALFE